MRVRTGIKLLFFLIAGIFLLYVIFFTVINHMVNPGNLNPDENFKSELISSLIYAEKITVTEHSNIWDWSQGEFEATATKVRRKIGNSEQEIEVLENKTLPVIIYKKLELDFYQRIKLLVLTKLFAVGKSNSPSLCIFSSHHEINFYTANMPTKTLDVCFQCKQIMWNYGEVNTSSLMYKILQHEINSFGMTAERDWQDYLIQWKKRNHIESYLK